MEIIKKYSERTMKVSSTIATYKQLGAKITNLGTSMRYKDLRDGGKISEKITVYEAIIDMKPYGGDTIEKFYMMEDSLGHEMQNVFSKDKNEVLNYLKENGFKSEKRFYIEDYGMTEETWEEWNNA